MQAPRLIHLASSTQQHPVCGGAVASSSVALTADWYSAKQFESYGELMATLELAREVHKLDAHQCFTGIMVLQNGWTLYVQQVETYLGAEDGSMN